MSNDSNEPKIVVDDDWKEKVRAEREAARAARNAPEPTASQASAAGHPGEPDNFTLLVSMLATRALVALGKLPDPAQGHAVVRPEHAKQAIGLLTALEEKTKGNLTSEEQQMLEHLLHELRMTYLAVYKNPQESAQKTDGENPSG